MSRDVSPPLAALARVTGNLAFGLAPFSVLAGLHPSVSAQEAAAVWTCLLGTAGLAGCLHLGQRQVLDMEAGSEFRRLLSCLLLGGSLAAVPWHAQGLKLFPLAALTGFVARWWLYLLETRDLVAADQQKLALPCLATRIRRSITWITGLLIPLLLLTGLPGGPLLTLSFALTVFIQWIAAFELKIKELQG